VTWQRAYDRQWKAGNAYRWRNDPDSEWIAYHHESPGRMCLLFRPDRTRPWRWAGVQGDNPGGEWLIRPITAEEKLIVVKFLMSIRNDA
jgi:hypothetical protein